MPANNSAYPLSTCSKVSITSSASDSLVVAGGATFAGNVAVTGTLTGGSISYSSTTTGTLTISNTTGTTFTVASTADSTSVGTGAFVAQGGGSFAGNLYVGGSLVAGTVTYATTNTGTMTITTGTGTTLNVNSTTDSTSTSTGATVILGGVGVAKRINAGSLKCFDSTQASSTSTGCLQLVGGLGCAGNIYAGGVVYATNNASATSTSTGCAVFTGGIGVAGKVFADTLDTVGNLKVGGTTIQIGSVSAILVSSNKLNLNSSLTYDQVVVGKELSVSGKVIATNFTTTIDTDLTLVASTTFYDTPYFKTRVCTVGPDLFITTHYRFKLASGAQVIFKTYFESMLTLLNPLNRVVMGTGYVSGFNAPALVLGVYDVNAETRFMYPISGLMEMKQKAAPTVDGTPDPSLGYQYIFSVFNADPFIQLPNTLPSSNQVEYDANTSSTSTGAVTVFEVVLNFRIPVQ